MKAITFPALSRLVLLLIPLAGTLRGAGTPLTDELKFYREEASDILLIRLKDGVMTLDQRFKGSIAQKDVLARIARDGLQLDPSRGAITKHLIFLYPNSKVVAEGADSQSCIYAKEMTVREEAGKSWVVLPGSGKIPVGDLPRLMKETR